MDRCNELKLWVLAFFSSLDGRWLGPAEASFRTDRPGRISKDCQSSVCWRGVREVGVLWNTGSARQEWLGCDGCVPRTGLGYPAAHRPYQTDFLGIIWRVWWTQFLRGAG
jgi:hypothetical protein